MAGGRCDVCNWLPCLPMITTFDCSQLLPSFHFFDNQQGCWACWWMSHRRSGDLGRRSNGPCVCRGCRHSLRYILPETTIPRSPQRAPVEIARHSGERIWPFYSSPRATYVCSPWALTGKSHHPESFNTQGPHMWLDFGEHPIAGVQDSSGNTTFRVFQRDQYLLRHHHPSDDHRAGDRGNRYLESARDYDDLAFLLVNMFQKTMRV